MQPAYKAQRSASSAGETGKCKLLGHEQSWTLMSKGVKVFCKVSCPFPCPDFYSYGIFVYSLVWLYAGTTLSEPGPCHQSWDSTVFNVYSGITTIHLSQPTHVNIDRSSTFLKDYCRIRMSFRYLDVSERKLSGLQTSCPTLPTGFNNILFICSQYYCVSLLKF